jgi:hypothetical protein
LNNSNYDNSYGCVDFSHGHVIMFQYFGKNQKCKKMNS